METPIVLREAFITDIVSTSLRLLSTLQWKIEQMLEYLEKTTRVVNICNIFISMKRPFDS